jgi:glycosyltransferase involved in cell wall biosynthesis
MQSILYVNPTAVQGGAEEVLVQIMTAAQELGYAPVLVIPHRGWLAERAQAQDIPCEILSSLPDVLTMDHWAAQIKPWLPNALAIARLVRKYRAVLVHSNTPRTSYHGGLAARLAGVKAITHCHDLLGLPYQSKGKAWLLDALADWTLVVSNAVRDLLLQYLPRLQERIATLYVAGKRPLYANAVQVSLHALFDIPPGTRVIGSVSAMTPWKGQDVLIDAFRLVQAQMPNVHLVIVGGSQGSPKQDAYEAMLRARVRDYHLADKVTFTGWREDAGSLMPAFDIFAHVPTQPDPLPTVLTESCALGCAIVASRIGGIPEILGDDEAGLLVPPRDPIASAQAILSLMADPTRQAALRQSARRRFQVHFSWDQMKARLGGIYQKVLESQEPNPRL